MTTRHRQRGRRRAAATGAVLAALAVGGCSTGGPGSGPAAPASPPASPPAATRSAPAPRDTAGVTAWHKWGLKPLPPAPTPPADKPVKLSATGPVPVLSRIPTSQKVVFITIDDGQEKDPEFIEMMRDLRIPITMFLTNDVIRSDYGYFRQLQALGNHIQNHTVHHPVLSTLPPARQKEEICGDQEILTREYGTAPLLFRPPYGVYDTDTENAVAQCGPRAIVRWRESMQIHDMQYQTPGGKLHPGDIVLAHFRGPSELKGTTMTQMFAHLLKRIREQGFTVARLEDYLQAPAG
ncbi:polysaccharide deacetylase family protein [Streptomyces griseosporeus]|uniref:polysaccharide deacetylase family protein n=1 Tax=Streptomyces griseosporeus TaxID=1910 RepID=UPI0036F67030